LADKGLAENLVGSQRPANRRIRAKDEYNCQIEDALALLEGDVAAKYLNRETTVAYQ
jgi:hypothetical protein